MESGTLFGGAFKLRNALEAGTLVLAIGLPVFRLPISLTMRIILLCLTAPAVGAHHAYRRIGRKPVILYFQLFPLPQKRRIVSQPAEEDSPTQPNDLKGHRARAAPDTDADGLFSHPEDRTRGHLPPVTTDM